MEQDNAIEVRPATGSDLKAIIDLDPRRVPASRHDYWRGRLRACEQGTDPRILVAEAEGSVVGVIVGEVRAWEFDSPPCGWVLAIMVHPQWRERGVGSRLLAALHGQFREAGVSRMRTMVARDYHTVLAFFRSHGMMAGPYIELECGITDDDATASPGAGADRP